MRLPSIILAVSALTLLASGATLSADTDKSLTVSTMASPDSSIRDVGGNNEGRFLRVHETAVENDGSEERLSGANMFNAEKIKQAMTNSESAKTLYRRWKRYGFEGDDAFNKLKAQNIGKDTDVYNLYKNYVTWLDTHHPLNVAMGDKKMFDRTKLEKAMGDGKYANTLFGRWKRNGLETDDVFKRFQKMGVKEDNKLYKLYTDYYDWLLFRHPAASSKKVTDKDFLFDSVLLRRATDDTPFAEKLFARWRTSGMDSDPVYRKFKRLDILSNGKFNQLYKDYFAWLQIHYPTV